MLTFYHWFSISSGDSAVVEISAEGGDWEKIAGPFEGTSGGWSPYVVPLSSYAGQEVRIAFRLKDNGNSSTSWGWYVDDVHIVNYPEEAPDSPILQEVNYQGGDATLTWVNPPSDFEWIAIYAGTSEDFVPFLGNRIALVQGTTYQDMERTSWHYHFKISAVNAFRLESDIADPNVLTGVNEPDPDVDEGETTNDYPEIVATKLYNNHPNPFNPATIISYDLRESQVVKITIYGVDGRVVRKLVDEPKPRGHYQVNWAGLDDRGQSVPSGIYLYRFSAGDHVETKRMVLVK
jgi:hypothetical protein